MKTMKVKKTFSRGLALAPAFVVGTEKVVIADYLVADSAGVAAEQARFDKAVEAVSAELSKLAETNAIFEGHLALANDFMLKDGVYTRITDAKQNAESALDETITELRAIFESMDDEYMRERAADVVDVGNRIQAALQGRSTNRFSGMSIPSIIIAEDLAPSDTANLNLALVKGFITEKGGTTSHVSIMARSLGIPAIVGAAGIMAEVTPDMLIAFNAASGDITLDPDAAFLENFKREQEQFLVRAKQLEEHSKLPAVTLDGHEIKAYANVGNVQDIRNAQLFNVQGVGLFRSEFLFMENDHFPTEEEQFNVYKEAITTLGGELIIRTLDIGGDKGLSYFEFPLEENPFLGYRAIRLCMDRTDVFKTQLRALLRASAFGPIRIMLPMIISVDELIQSKEIIETCKVELKEQGYAYNAAVPVGVMIETPAAVFMARDLAKHAAFFSIGTNDLTQYVLAVDRGNERIAHLYDTYHPAVLRAIHEIIQAGHAGGIEVGMCGEFASDLLAVEMLLGFGLDEFSMAAGETPLVKEKVRSLNFTKAKENAEAVLRCSTTDEVKALLASQQA